MFQSSHRGNLGNLVVDFDLHELAFLNAHGLKRFTLSHQLITFHDFFLSQRTSHLTEEA